MDKRIKKQDTKKEIFPEYEFLGSCLRIGLSLDDLNELTYVDVMKVLLTYLDDKSEGRIATQEDIDKLLG